MSNHEPSVGKKSYDRTPSKTSRSSSGFFSKVTHLFRSITEPTSDTIADGNHDYSDMNSDQSVIYRPEHGSFYRDADTSGISNISITSKTANETLAEFFMKKGSEPLNDIEFEGVVSLMSKANQANQSFSGSQAGNSSFFSSSPLRRSSEVESSNIDNKLMKTPIKLQSSLKNTHSDRKYLVPQTIKKRVINYSKLPSPYRTRISSPLTSYIESKQSTALPEKRSTSSTSIRSPSTSSILEVSTNSEVGEDTLPHKPLSSTANVLLSSLENKQGNHKRRPSSSFSNPYSLLTKRVTKNNLTSKDDKPKEKPLETTEIVEIIGNEKKDEDNKEKLEKMDVTEEETPKILIGEKKRNAEEKTEEKAPSIPKFNFSAPKITVSTSITNPPSFDFKTSLPVQPLSTTKETAKITEITAAKNNMPIPTFSFNTTKATTTKPSLFSSKIESSNDETMEEKASSPAASDFGSNGTITAEKQDKASPLPSSLPETTFVFPEVSSSNIDLLKYVDEEIAKSYDDTFVF